MWCTSGSLRPRVHHRTAAAAAKRSHQAFHPHLDGTSIRRSLHAARPGQFRSIRNEAAAGERMQLFDLDLQLEDEDIHLELEDEDTAEVPEDKDTAEVPAPDEQPAAKSEPSRHSRPSPEALFEFADTCLTGHPDERRAFLRSLARTAQHSRYFILCMREKPDFNPRLERVLERCLEDSMTDGPALALMARVQRQFGLLHAPYWRLLDSYELCQQLSQAELVHIFCSAAILAATHPFAPSPQTVQNLTVAARRYRPRQVKAPPHRQPDQRMEEVDLALCIFSEDLGDSWPPLRDALLRAEESGTKSLLNYEAISQLCAELRDLHQPPGPLAAPLQLLLIRDLRWYAGGRNGAMFEAVVRWLNTVDAGAIDRQVILKLRKVLNKLAPQLSPAGVSDAFTLFQKYNLRDPADFPKLLLHRVAHVAERMSPAEIVAVFRCLAHYRLPPHQSMQKPLCAAAAAALGDMAPRDTAALMRALAVLLPHPEPWDGLRDAVECGVQEKLQGMGGDELAAVLWFCAVLTAPTREETFDREKGRRWKMLGEVAARALWEKTAEGLSVEAMRMIHQANLVLQLEHKETRSLYESCKQVAQEHPVTTRDFTQNEQLLGQLSAKTGAFAAALQRMPELEGCTVQTAVPVGDGSYVADILISRVTQDGNRREAIVQLDDPRHYVCSVKAQPINYTGTTNLRNHTFQHCWSINTIILDAAGKKAKAMGGWKFVSPIVKRLWGMPESPVNKPKGGAFLQIGFCQAPKEETEWRKDHRLDDDGTDTDEEDMMLEMDMEDELEEMELKDELEREEKPKRAPKTKARRPRKMKEWIKPKRKKKGGKKAKSKA